MDWTFGTRGEDCGGTFFFFLHLFSLWHFKVLNKEKYIYTALPNRADRSSSLLNVGACHWFTLKYMGHFRNRCKYSPLNISNKDRLVLFTIQRLYWPGSYGNLPPYCNSCSTVVYLISLCNAWRCNSPQGDPEVWISALELHSITQPSARPGWGGGGQAEVRQPAATFSRASSFPHPIAEQLWFFSRKLQQLFVMLTERNPSWLRGVYVNMHHVRRGKRAGRLKKIIMTAASRWIAKRKKNQRVLRPRESPAE